MVALNTVVIDRNGDRVVINQVDYDPKKHKLWKAKKKVIKKVAEMPEEMPEEVKKEPAKLNKKVVKKDT